MPFTFRVIFSGICAFVPDGDRSFDDLDPEKRPKAATVVLPDLLLSAPVDGGTREPHVAFLEVDSPLGWEGRQPDMVFRRQRDIFLLRGQSVSFRFGNAAAPEEGLKVLNFDGHPPADPVSPQAGEERFFWWVPKMARVAPGSERIQAHLVAPAQGQDTSWIRLEQGELSSEVLSSRIMEFKPINGRVSKLRQRLAASIAWEVKNVESVSIVFTEPGLPGERVLTLNGAEVQGPVTVRIKNREIHDLIREDVDRLDPLPDVDFHVYYDMSSARDTIPRNGRLIPHAAVSAAERRSTRAILRTARPLSHIHGGVCPPTAFSGVAAALDDTATTRSVRMTSQKAAKTARSKRKPR